MERATSGRLLPESISNVGPHYPRTLREWRRRFEDNFADTERALRKEHPGVFESEQGMYELAVFRRKWLCKEESHFGSTLSNLLTFFLTDYLSVYASLLGKGHKLTIFFGWFIIDLSCYCEIGFAKRILGGKIPFFSIPYAGMADDATVGEDHIITFTREGHDAMGCDVFEWCEILSQ
jgi:hypothetical protein